VIVPFGATTAKATATGLRPVPLQKQTIEFLLRMFDLLQLTGEPVFLTAFKRTICLINLS